MANSETHTGLMNQKLFKYIITSKNTNYLEELSLINILHITYICDESANMHWIKLNKFKELIYIEFDSSNVNNVSLEKLFKNKININNLNILFLCYLLNLEKLSLINVLYITYICDESANNIYINVINKLSNFMQWLIYYDWK